MLCIAALCWTSRAAAQAGAQSQNERAIRAALHGAPHGYGVCVLRAVRVHRGRLYVACGPAGVWVLERVAGGHWRVVDRLATKQEATALIKRDGELWVRAGAVEGPVLALPSSARTPRGRAFEHPARTTGWELRGQVRHFLSGGIRVPGLLAEFELGFRAASPLHVSAVLEPLGFASSSMGSTRAVAASLLIGYDTASTEFALGAGAQTVNEPQFGQPKGWGLVLPALARIGAKDSLHLVARSGLVVHRRRLGLASFDLLGLVPLWSSHCLLVRAGSSVAGQQLAELGYRTPVAAGGNAPLLALFSAGWARLSHTSVFSSPHGIVDRVWIEGFVAGVGLEWRR